MTEIDPHNSGQSMDAVADAIRREIHGEPVGLATNPPTIECDVDGHRGGCTPVDPDGRVQFEAIRVVIRVITRSVTGRWERLWSLRSRGIDEFGDASPDVLHVAVFAQSLESVLGRLTLPVGFVSTVRRDRGHRE